MHTHFIPVDKYVSRAKPYLTPPGTDDGRTVYAESHSMIASPVGTASLTRRR